MADALSIRDVKSIVSDHVRKEIAAVAENELDVAEDVAKRAKVEGTEGELMRAARGGQRAVVDRASYELLHDPLKGRGSVSCAP